ncbi:MAG: hypothetical protein R2752_16375 [Vicinamibacterales bacterium]
MRFALVLVGLLLAAPPPPPARCACLENIPPPGGWTPDTWQRAYRAEVERAVRDSTVVFYGRVLEHSVTTSTFRVDRVWKGPHVPTLQVSNGTVDLGDGRFVTSGCSRSFRPLGRYIVFASADDGLLSSSTCGPTHETVADRPIFKLLDRIVQPGGLPARARR